MTEIIPVRDALEAVLLTAVAGVLVGGVAGAVAAHALGRRRARQDQDRLHRVGWALSHLADRFRETDGRWESGEIVALLDNIIDVGRRHPFDGVRLGLRARLAAARIRRRADGGAR